MDKVIELQSVNKVREEASEWVIRFENESVGPDDVQSFRQWFNISSEHREEFLELARLWGGMDLLSTLAEIMPLSELEPEQQEAPGWGRFAMPAAVLSMCLLIGFLLPTSVWTEVFSSTDGVYVTGVGSQQTVNLSDGSVIALNTGSEVTVNYTHDSRMVDLQYGEAHFEVKSDPGRPFTVRVGSGVVRAVGTAFNIQYYQDTVGVIVTEGIVEVDAPATLPEDKHLNDSKVAKIAPLEKISVGAGQFIEYGQATRVVADIERKDIDRKLAWQRGMIIFEGESLKDAVDEIKRYTSTEIIIKDPEIQNIQVGGYFRTGEIEVMLKVFESSFGINVTRVNDDVIELSAMAGAYPD